MFPWVAPDELERLACAADDSLADQPASLAAPLPLYLYAPEMQQRMHKRNGFVPHRWRTLAFQIKLLGNAAMSVQTLRDALACDKDFELEQQEGATVWGYVDYLPGDRASLRRLARTQRLLRRWQVRGYIEYQLRRITGE